MAPTNKTSSKKMRPVGRALTAWRQGNKFAKRFRLKECRNVWSRTTCHLQSLNKKAQGHRPTFSLRKEVIQPQVLLRLPCYDFTPIIDYTLGRCFPKVG